MLMKTMFQAVSSAKRLISCKKGASSELLSAVGLIAITVGIISLVGPELRNQVSNMVNNALAAASTIFQGTWGP